MLTTMCSALLAHITPGCPCGTVWNGVCARAGRAPRPVAACGWQRAVPCARPPSGSPDSYSMAFGKGSGQMDRGQSHGGTPRHRQARAPHLSFLVTLPLIPALSSGWHGDGDGDGDGVSLPSSTSSHMEGCLAVGDPGPAAFLGREWTPRILRGDQQPPHFSMKGDHNPVPTEMLSVLPVAPALLSTETPAPPGVGPGVTQLSSSISASRAVRRVRMTLAQ